MSLHLFEASLHQIRREHVPMKHKMGNNRMIQKVNIT